MYTHRLSTRFIPVAVVILALTAFAGPADAAYRQGEVLIRYKPGLRAQAQSAISAAGATVVRDIDQIRARRVKLPPGMSVEDAIERFKKNPNVEYVGPNHVVSVCLEPNDDIYNNGLLGLGVFLQWGLYSIDYPDADIDAPQAWDITTGSSDLVIAVIDTGIDTDHEDLWEKIVPGQNVIAGAPDPNNYEDDHGHGSFVAGIAAAMTDNGIGIAGTSWGTMIMPIKAIAASGYGAEDDAAAGIVWAADHGAKIINMSFAGEDAPLEQAAVEYAWSLGCVLVAASGNEDTSVPMYPAAYDEVLVVGATNELKQRCTAADWFTGGSNYGDHLDVMAPGNNIVSTSNGMGLWGDYSLESGTSAAAPFVSGTAALVWSEHSDWTNAEVVEQIKMTCDDISPSGWDQYTGWGLVSAYHALVDTPAVGLTIGDLSYLPSGTFVKVSNVVITSGKSDMADRFYVEQEDRACGTMVPFDGPPPAGYSEGDLVEIVGTVMTVDGERAIENATLTKTGSRTPLEPIALTNKLVGGGRIGFKSGVTDGIGLNNIGLLVTVFGRVTAPPGWTYFYIDDVSGCLDGSGFTGLKVICWDMDKPAQGTYVRVTGISSCQRPEGAGVSIPVIRVRRQSDIVAVE